jgi:hypothetical protein
MTSSFVWRLSVGDTSARRRVLVERIRRRKRDFIGFLFMLKRGCDDVQEMNERMDSRFERISNKRWFK